MSRRRSDILSRNAAAVLAVDDNATIRKAISMRLSSNGYRVVTAESGSEALELIEQEPFDLVLLDLKMPQMCGEEVLERLRKRYTETELPVIMLAASSDRNDIRRTLQLGANDYVTKPGDLPMLLARIKTQLSLKRTAEKLRAAEFSASGVERTASHVERTIDQLAHEHVHRELLGDGETADEYRYHVIYDNTPMTCFALNKQGEVLFANRFALHFLGYQREDLTRQSILDFYAPEDRPLAAEHIASVCVSEGRLHRWDIRRQKKNGTILWVRETAIAIGGDSGGMILMTCEDINDTYILSETLRYQSSHDELTGLANRKALEERLHQVIDSAHAEDTEHVLAVIDLDQFKIINDTCGHSAGDELLRQVAKLLKTRVRKRDTFARLGGDEFALLMEDCNLNRGRAEIEGIRAALEDFVFSWADRTHRIGASIGIVAINKECEGTNSALSMADTACFAAKDSGRNRIHCYQKDNLTVTRHHGEMRWATRINDALAEDRFELHFQRINPVEFVAGSGAHYEILIRMRDELGNVVMPIEFLPAAERYSLAAKIDRWVIGSAMQWLGSQPQDIAGLHLCAINLSAQSLGDEDVMRYILEQMETHAIPAHKLCFEVTETAAISDLAQAIHFITQLKNRGCMFALDDFGSGFSSFAYLKKLPVDFLKIDGGFVRDIGTDSVDRAMVRSINEIGHMMGKKTIAEFVEDQNILNILQRIGVDYAQGFQIGRPLPLAHFSL